MEDLGHTLNFVVATDGVLKFVGKTLSDPIAAATTTANDAMSAVRLEPPRPRVASQPMLPIDYGDQL